MTAKRLQYMALSLLPSLRTGSPHAVLMTFCVSAQAWLVSRGSGSGTGKASTLTQLLFYCAVGEGTGCRLLQKLALDLADT